MEREGNLENIKRSCYNCEFGPRCDDNKSLKCTLERWSEWKEKKEKLCLIIYGKLSWFLKVNDTIYSFTGSCFAEYLEDVHKKLGYIVKWKNSYNRDDEVLFNTEEDMFNDIRKIKITYKSF